MAEKVQPKAYVTLRGSVVTLGDHTCTVYYSVAVDKPAHPMCEAIAAKMIKEAEKKFFSTGTRTVSTPGGEFHPHRGIDDARMFHSWNRRRMQFECGSTKPGAAHFSIWY